MFILDLISWTNTHDGEIISDKAGKSSHFSLTEPTAIPCRGSQLIVILIRQSVIVEYLSLVAEWNSTMHFILNMPEIRISRPCLTKLVFNSWHEYFPSILFCCLFALIWSLWRLCLTIQDKPEKFLGEDYQYIGQFKAIFVIFVKLLKL